MVGIPRHGWQGAVCWPNEQGHELPLQSKVVPVRRKQSEEGPPPPCQATTRDLATSLHGACKAAAESQI